MFIPGQKEGGATEHAVEISKLVSSYTYDVFNQLVKSEGSEGGSSYAYNGEGYMVEKDIDGRITRYLYEGDKVELETDNRGQETARNCLIQTLYPGKLSNILI